MAFPQTRLPVVVELDLAGDGTFSTDLTAVTNAAGRKVVRASEGITITRGRQDEAGETQPSTCTLTVDNSDGRFSPRNPMGAYYGSLRRNTPIRVSITSATSWLQVTAATGATPASGARVTCPDSANLSITGDLDLRFDADLDAWRGTTVDLVAKWGTAGNCSYIMILETNGQLSLFWSTNGTNQLFVRSDAILPRQVGRMAVRAVLDVDNGGGGYTAAFYYSDTLSGSWTLLGNALGTSSGTTSIFDSTTVCTVLDTASGSQSSVIRGRVYGAEIRQGVGGTVRASPDFTAQTHGATSFADAQGNTWTLTGAVALTTRDVRFVGEVPSWPVQWDLSQRNVETQIEASGVLRRLQTGERPLRSTIYRAMTSQSSLVEYWPMEDGSDTTEAASALGGAPMRPANFTDAQPSWASYDGFDCSDPVPTLALNSDLRGPIPRHTSTGEYQFRGLIKVDASTMVNGSEILSVNFTGTAANWQVRYSTGGILTLRAFDQDQTSLLTDGPWAFDVDGKELLLHLALTQVGANISYALATWEMEAEAAGLAIAGTLNSRTIGRATRWQWNTNGGTEGMVVGHAVVQNDVTTIYDRLEDLRAYRGEAAATRIARLATENGVAFAGYGPSNGTEMGPQKSGTLVDLIRECEDSDAGILFESRDQLALAFRPRRSLHTQTATVTLDYEGRTLSEFVPVEDDDATRNDITVSRVNGSSARAMLETGALSTAAPPDGIGSYPTEYSLSLEDDTKLSDHAGWRLSVGTVDEARYPTIVVNLAASGMTDALRTALRRLDVGDMLAVQNPPAGWMAPDDVEQIAVGFTEYLGPKAHVIEVNCTPASVYRVGMFNSGSGATETKAGLRGTVTAEALDTTETGIDITCPAGQPGWGHGDGNYLIVIGGESMLVTAVTAPGTSQTLTVQRSQNGVVKSHLTGQPVELYRPVKYGLI